MAVELTSILTAGTPVVVGLALALLAAHVAGRRIAVALWFAAAACVALAPLGLRASADGGPLPAVFTSITYQLFVMILALGTLIAAALAVFARKGSAPLTVAAKRSLAGVGGNDERSRSKLRRLLMREHNKIQAASEMYRYLELATHNSQITVFLQDADLNYVWIVNPRLGFSTEEVIGKSDYDILPPDVQPLVIGHKQRALATASKQTFESEIVSAEGKNWFRVDVVPLKTTPEGQPTAIVCTAIDITRAKRLDMMRTDLSRRLAETLQRFNLALRSEKIVVFSQDVSLRYTWANSDETQVGSVVGRTEEEVIPPDDRPAIVALKRRAIETRTAQAGEVGVGAGSDRRWYDLYVEPNVQPDGRVSGITCASIDITNRKRNEEQMRLVMRELTHRTKNLLAVVMAIARQTSGQASDVETFVPALIGRLRALSAAQDLIVADDWAGVAIDDLLNAIMGGLPVRVASRVTVEGPRVILSPEASQNLGLAVHELAMNALSYGSLSEPAGRLSISWSIVQTDTGNTVVLDWHEAGGPPVSVPTTKGFGMMVIERNLTRALQADVKLDFKVDGLRARIALPLEGLVPMLRDDQKRLAEAS